MFFLSGVHALLRVLLNQTKCWEFFFTAMSWCFQKAIPGQRLTFIGSRKGLCSAYFFSALLPALFVLSIFFSTKELIVFLFQTYFVVLPFLGMLPFYKKINCFLAPYFFSSPFFLKAAFLRKYLFGRPCLFSPLNRNSLVRRYILVTSFLRFWSSIKKPGC